MSTVLISESEKTFVLHGVQDDVRVDGRGRKDVRPIVFETELVTHASGSAHLRLANTDVLVGVKAELIEPLPERPDEGRMEFFVDCSANATPEFEGRGGEDLALEISQTLSHAYNDKQVFDLSALSILPGKHAWILYVDILILECGGNLFDAVSLAVKAALYSTVIPKVSVTLVDGGEPELSLSDDPFDGTKLRVSQCPVLLTLARIGNYCVVDPTPEEESCTAASLVVGVTPDGRITTMRKMGAGSFHQHTLGEALKLGVEVGQDVHKQLESCLKKLADRDEGQEIYGFMV